MPYELDNRPGLGSIASTAEAVGRIGWQLAKISGAGQLRDRRQVRDILLLACLSRLYARGCLALGNGGAQIGSFCRAIRAPGADCRSGSRPARDQRGARLSAPLGAGRLVCPR